MKKKFELNKNRNIKQAVKKEILRNNIKLHKIEKLIHPFVRSKMYSFLKKNENKYLFWNTSSCRE